MTVCTRDPVPFYDSENDTKVYTHRHTFTEKLLPFLLLGGEKTFEATMDGIKPVRLRILYNVLGKFLNCSNTRVSNSWPGARMQPTSPLFAARVLM